MTTLSSTIADLRERLLVLRDDLVAALASADQLDAGRVSLLGAVGMALRAIDDMAEAPGRPPARETAPRAG